MPNSNFSILDYGPKDWVTSAARKTSGGSWVHLNFARLPQKGDCFDVTFSIRQEAMAFSQGNDISFQFTPGWFDFATIKNLTIAWALPGDSTLVRRLEPQPKSIDDHQAVWKVESLTPNQKYKVSLLLGRAAYPNFREPARVPAPAASSTYAASSSGSESGPAVLLLVIVVAAALVGGYSALSGGDDYGGYPQSSTSGSGWGGGSSHRSSSSCVHSSCARSCACACACAGGGRVGCSRKEFAYHIK